MKFPRYFKPLSPSCIMMQFQGSTARLTVNDEGETIVGVFSVSADGSYIQGQKISSGTTGAEAKLRYHFFLGNNPSAQGTELLYTGEIAPDADATNIANWTITAGTRTTTQFENEVVAAILFGGVGFMFALNKRVWAGASGYIDDGINGCESKRLDIVLTVIDGAAPLIHVSTFFEISQHRMSEVKEDVSFAASFYPIVLPDGTYFIADANGRVTTHVFPHPRPEFGWVGRAIHGSNFNASTYPGTPAGGLTVTGDLSGGTAYSEGRSTDPNEVNVNGYQPLWAVLDSYSTNNVFRITKNADNSDCDYRKRWNVESLDIELPNIGGDGQGRYYFDPFRDGYNGEKVIWTVEESFDLAVRYDNGGGVVQSKVIDRSLGGVTNYPFRDLKITQDGDLLTFIGQLGTNYKEIILYRHNGGGTFWNTADFTPWTIDLFDTESAGSFVRLVSLEIVGYDATYDMPIIATVSAQGNVYRYTYNGGVTETAADWDKTLWFAIPDIDFADIDLGGGLTGITMGWNVVANVAIIATPSTHYRVDLSTLTIEQIIGDKSLKAMYANSIIY